MPANLTPAYFEAEKRYRAAETAEEKIETLNEMLRVMPKHKGTDGLRADLRTKIAKLTKEAAKTQATSKKGGMYHIPKEGAGQIALVGLPNVGKTQLVTLVTDAVLDVADYPFTTKLPQLGMTRYENVQIQLVDMPPIIDQEARPWFASVLRAADGLLLMVDLSLDAVEQVEALLVELEKFRIGMEGCENPLPEALFFKKSIIVGNKSDIDAGGDNFSKLKEHYGHEVPVLAISAEDLTGLDELARSLFEMLGVVRIYTKSPGKDAKMDDPMIVREGSTVEEAAEAVHKDFRRNLKYALIWGSGKFPGQRVKRDHVVKDGDILELHT